MPPSSRPWRRRASAGPPPMRPSSPCSWTATTWCARSRQLIPTILGKIINDMLSKSFPELLDPNFTAAMELRLDEVEEGKSDWQTMIREFYGPFQSKVNSVARDPGIGEGRHGREDRRGLRDLRQAHGEEAGPLRFLPRLHGFSRVQEHQAGAAGSLSRARAAAGRSWRASASAAGAGSSTAARTIPRATS